MYKCINSIFGSDTESVDGFLQMCYFILGNRFKYKSSSPHRIPLPKILIMKQFSILILMLFFFSISAIAQNEAPPASKQIGITGLPIIYLNNGAGNNKGFNGIALYGSVGWFIKDYNVVGLRPFLGVVDSGFDRVQRLHSLGTNVYYRRYLNRNRFSFFVDANVGFGYIWYSSKFPNFNESLNDLNGIMFNYAIGPGVDYEIKNRWNLELSLQYLQMKNIDHPEDTNVGKTIIPSIGIQKFF